MMTDTELTAALAKFAAADLRAAKREGYTLVGGTKAGTLSLTHVAGVYTLTDTASKVLAQGKPAVVRPVLAILYTLEVQG